MVLASKCRGWSTHVKCLLLFAVPSVESGTHIHRREGITTALKTFSFLETWVLC